MRRAHVRGLAAGIVKDGELVWSRGYGKANGQRNATPETLFNLASVSKTVTATAAMQLHDDGKLDLDANVNAYLPFKLRHPRYPDRAITIRHLLTHTASVKDDWNVLDAGYTKGDSPVALGTFLRRYLDRNGGLYNASRNFYRHAPGSRFEYSNVGYALVGYIVERISGQPFDKFCRQRIFQPLGMSTTSWRLSDLDLDDVAMPYEYRGGRYRPYGHYGYPDYPNGLLRSSVRELSRFVAAHLAGGRLDGEIILRPATARAMRTPQIPSIASDMGFGLFIDRFGGVAMTGHDGGDYGVSTQMWFSRPRGIGVVLLTNGDALRNSESKALDQILLRLVKEAGSL